MVTTLRLDRIAYFASRRVMPGENWRPEGYMAALKDSGFSDINMDDKQDSGMTFQTIHATASK